MRWASLSLLIFIFVLPQGVIAVGDDFIISTLISNDTVSPTAPSSLVATSVGTDSVSLSWGASSDNIGVTGYNVWRDGVLVATTTLTSFLDGGLTAATTYSYYATAFDAAGNVSASSTSSLVTTDSLPPSVATSTGGSQSTKVERVVEIRDLSTEITERTITIAFTTSQPVRLKTLWGQTASYEIGYSTSVQLTTNHKIFITNLEPDTRYYFLLEGATNYPNLSVKKELVLFTKAGVDNNPPTNVNNFTAQAEEKGIQLAWNNPDDQDFSHVRIVRSEGFFPLDEAAGMVVYEGGSETWLDTLVSEDVARYYYTAFAYDVAGNRSSGAVAHVSWNAQVEVVDTGAPLEDLKREEFATILFRQGSFEQYASSGLPIRVVGEEALLISVPYETMPEHLKSIIVTLTEKSTGVEFSFLLRINKEGNAYEAILGAFENSGEYTYTITLYDYVAKGISKHSGELLVLHEQKDDALSLIEKVLWQHLLSGLVLLFLGGWLIIILRRRLSS